MLLGAIADDLTGATDLALTLSREGMRTVQTIGIPAPGFDFGDIDALVIALKSRTIPAADAVAISLSAANRLMDAGVEQILFKYCSTFDSTPQGNIGPVAEALLAHLGEGLTIACPAFPTTGRTLYRGHLFVGDMLLSDSPMKDHPLNPMTDPNLVRFLQRQTALPVGLVPLDVVEKGCDAVRAACSAARERGDRIMIVDAINDANLRVIGEALSGMKLVTGGSGIALGLPENFRKAGKLPPKTASGLFDAPRARSAILAGSCSAATRRQVEVAIAAGTPALQIDPLSVAQKSVTVDDVVEWITASTHAAPLVYSSAHPDAVKAAQDLLGREKAGALIEDLLAEVAVALCAAGFRRFIIAGGETSGAVVNALGFKALRIGPEIDPGVPWTLSLDPGRTVALALKSGNFGAEDFFLKAWSLLS
jgi:uncharacterized protein YgbK (DUF1537 family)